MDGTHQCDEELLRRLPLPLAQLYRRAHNAKTELERHLAAFYLWEAALKLLASAALVEYAAIAKQESPLAEEQQKTIENLARPSLGHWWEFVRLLVPKLAERGDEPFRVIRDLLLGRAKDDMPRAAGLDAALRETLTGQKSSRATVQLTELFHRLVQLRNEELGHGAAGQRSRDFYDRMGSAMLAGVAEIFARVDVRAGRRLVYVAEVRRQATGGWLIERYELVGESARRLESLEAPEAATAASLPRPARVYLESATTAAEPPLFLLCCILLLTFDADRGEVLFFNKFDRSGQKLTYLCYTTSGTSKLADPEGEHRQLMARVLGQPIDAAQLAAWAERAAAEMPEAAPSAGPLREVGDFELLSELGQGGMGIVYRARQPTLGREVALKLMLRVGNPKAEARFAREIRALGQVEHPHLVKVFSSGAEGDRWFYTMELVEGTTLAVVHDKLSTAGSRAAEVDLHAWKQTLSLACQETRRAERPISGSAAAESAPASDAMKAPDAVPASAAAVPISTDRGYVRQMTELVRQVADAAHALHEAGVIHRDIKPGNIMVSDDGARAILMDLGLAQLDRRS